MLRRIGLGPATAEAAVADVVSWPWEGEEGVTTYRYRRPWSSSQSTQLTPGGKMMLPSGFLTTHPPLAAAAAAALAAAAAALLPPLALPLPLLPLPQLLLSTASMSKFVVAARPAEEGAPRWRCCRCWLWFSCTSMSSAFKARLMCPSFIPALRRSS